MNTKKEYTRPDINCMAMDAYTPLAASPVISGENAKQDASSNRFDYMMWEEEQQQ